MKKVYVLMSTYNGEEYLSEQVDSILNQTGVDVELWIRDDGSSDNTLNMLHQYKNEHENVVVFEGENLGYIKSFMWLINNCNYEKDAYYAFSDQDDIWDPEKMVSAVNKLEALDDSKPNMYYSDLKVVDKDGEFIRLANSWEGTIDKYKLSVFIGIRGCTMVFNDVLFELLKPYKINDISGHDTYIALIAYWLGNVVYDSNPYINYRQTGNNLSITGTSSVDKLKKNLIYFKKRLTIRKSIHEKNAKELMSHYYSSYPDELEELKEISEYRRGMNRFKLLFNRKYKKFSLPIRVFNDIFILIGKL